MIQQPRTPATAALAPVLCFIAILCFTISAGFLLDSIQDLLSDFHGPGAQPLEGASFKEWQRWLSLKAHYEGHMPGNYSCLAMAVLSTALSATSLLLFFFAGRAQRAGSAISSLHAIQLVLLALLALLLAVPDGAYRGLLNTHGVWDYLLIQLAPAAAFGLLSIGLHSFAGTGSSLHKLQRALAVAQLLGFAWFSSQLFYGTIGWTVDAIL
ncbi:hypothetical protein IT575_02370 [bacterium]|nr:hypothetical protein [bacterium]